MNTTTVKKNDHRLLQILLAPIVSEKATLVADKYEQVLFKVVRDANKQEIKQAVEMFFKVDVESVQILNRKGKVKGRGTSVGRRAHSKRAYVCLKPGQQINFETEAR